ncbi:uncharacterized protein BO80DRAFT_364471 [Aspergillus ibericus CBS 121593]|uniref:Protein ZIP4 homolog n=1 Tax=Aspergillus ibericus CBS 121593 TaxID=1448316 RepID=A0A395GP05_9EURO|nr:hypothetical protein BO80DRAFT_364471 [Aspergillus ibericus CBS 121593]RAK97225.1 hypothetical protein BO80DRAFT_364471 [Aspergillus ibericus CBS 121593]
MSVLQFLFTEFESLGWENNTLLNEIVTLLDSEQVVLGRIDPEAQNDIFSASELEWFSKTSYNIALKSLKPSERHYLLCDFLKTVRIAGDTRKETDVTEKTKLYHEIHKASAHFREQTKTHQTEIRSTEAQHEEWLSNYRIILALDLEASVFLNDWTTVSIIIEESSAIIDEKLSSIFLDCILRSEAAITDMVRTVKELVRTLHGSPSPHLPKTYFQETLPRYLRCLFQLSLDAADYHLAESVLDQALVLARDRRTESSRSPYPSDEIQWLSTVAFNRAVDYYLLSADADCQRWAEKAITLADLDDCEALGRLLRGKFETLK